MELNLSKTKNMVFRNGGIVKQAEKWYFEGVDIEIYNLQIFRPLFYTQISLDQN